jgi:hypothetical protein
MGDGVTDGMAHIEQALRALSLELLLLRGEVDRLRNTVAGVGAFLVGSAGDRETDLAARARVAEALDRWDPGDDLPLVR